MANATHTPGPWFIDPKYLSEIQTADDKTICSAWHEHAADRTITVTGVLACSLEESAANARLIAAAPDLLEAVKILLPENNRGDQHLRPGFEQCEKARAAIAKAEGRS